MPIFDYHCEACNFDFEKILFKRDQPVQCPKCGGEVNKKPSRFAFKGDGISQAGTHNCQGCERESCANCSAGS